MTSASEIDVSKVDSIIDEYNADKELLTSILHEVQAEYGYLPREALIRVSDKLEIPLGQVYGVATFYKAFSLVPKGRHQICVCLGTACHVRGATAVLQSIERELGIMSGESTGDMEFALETVNCLGVCALGPIVMIDGKYHGEMTPDKVGKLLKKTIQGIRRSGT
jgi:NADH-quinone oxidoreductase subunit E